MLGNSSVVVVFVRTRPRLIPLAIMTMRKSTHGFTFLSHDEYGAPHGGPTVRPSSAIRFGSCDIQNNQDLGKDYQPL